MAKTNTNYSILVGVELQTAGIQKQLDNATKQTKLKIDDSEVKNAASSLSNLNDVAEETDLTFQAANEVFRRSIEILSQMASQVYELNTAIIEFQKVSDLSGEDLDDYIDKLSNMGSAVARTGSEMVEAATEFRKNGFNDEDAAQLGQIASMYQNVSDEAISASDSASFIIAQMVAFGIEAENASHIIDAVNETANSFAVSSGQLANSLGIVSSTASAMGNSMEETIGMMVAITEQTRNSSKAARGLNAIFNNLAQVLDDSSTNGKKIAEIFDNLGVSMYGVDGQLLSSYELLTNLNEKWDTLDTNTKNYIASTIAGTVQLNNFLALMNNFDHAVSATETALNSAGSAARENSKNMEGLEARTNQLKATFQDFSNNVLSSEFLGGLLSLTNGLLQLVNTPVGAFVTQVVLFTGAGWGLVKLFKAMNIGPVIMASLSNAFTGIKFAIEGTSLAMKGLVPATTATTLAMRAAVPIIGAVTIALGAFIKFAKWAIDVSKEQTVTLEEQIQIVDDLRSKIKSLNFEYEALKNQGDLSEADNARLRLLEAEIEANEKILQQEEKKLYYQQFGEGSTKTVRVDEDTSPASGYLTGTTTYTGGIAYGAAQQATAEPETKTTTGLDRLREEVVEFKKIQEQIADVEAQMDTATGDELIELNEKYSELTTNSKEYFDSISEQANSLSAFENIPEEAQSLLNYITLVFSGMADKAEESTDDISAEFKSMSESVAESVSELEGLSDAFDTLTGAVDEYNENGSISIDTLASLVELGDDYLSMLSFENGQLVLNSDALYDKAQQLRQTTIEEAKASAAAQLHSIAINGVGQAAVDANNAAGSSTGGLAIFESALDKVTNGAINATAAVSQLEVAFGGQWSGDQKKAMQDVINNYQNFVGLVNSSSLIGATGGSSGGGGGGSATDPIEEQSKVFQDQIAILEHELAILEKMGASEEERIAKSREIQEAIKKQEEWYRAQGLDDNSEYLRELEEQWWDYENSIEDLYKDMAQAHLDSLNEQKSAYEKLFDIIIETADKEIEALEQRKEEEEAYWDEKIAALEEQNEALDDQIEREEKLDALAKAKQSKVMVYKDGKFQYVSDIDAVSEAQADLDEYNREQELQDQIDKMEEQKDQALAALDEQIKGWEKYKEKWSAIVDKISDIQDIMLIEQALGIKLEGDNWQERLTNLGIFVSDYIDAEGNFNDEAINKNGELLRNEYEQVATEAAIWEQRLENFDEYIDEFIESQGDFVSKQEDYVDRVSEAWGNSLNSLNNYVQGCKDAAKELSNIDYGSGGGGGHPSLGKPSRLPEQQQFYASGTTNASGGISLVGERGPELRVLNSGDGIIPADITKNLWQWGVTTPASMMSSIVGGLQSMGQNIGITIQNFNPSLPNVTDGESFAKYMRNNFWREALQFAKT